MKLDENLAAVHAYLCADGYVVTSEKWKYYRAGLRNMNLVLLKDFQEKFEKFFGVKPTIRKDGRCEKCSKEIYEILTKEFGSFYSWKWRMPKMNKRLAKIWLRAYFDCEGWVFCKSHQNRHIGVDCVNEKGLNQVEKALNNLGINTIRKYNSKRKIHRLYIYQKESLDKFAKEIGFLHPEKSTKLHQVINDYVIYEWEFPQDEEECKKFILELLRNKVKIRRNRYLRLFSKEERNLAKLKGFLMGFYQVESKVHRAVNGFGTVYYELNINKIESIHKLINLNIIPNILNKN